MAGRRRNAKSYIPTGTGELVALSQADGSCQPQVQMMLQRGVSASNACMDPSELYASFSWKVDNPSQLFVHKINSPVFNVCGTQWLISTCPNPEKEHCMSLFLCVVNRDALLPGWSQYAQFTVSPINKNPLKSFYFDGFRRFSKSHTDWGWRDFMKLVDLVDGFMIENSVEFRIQVQLIREKPHPLSTSIERRYRRELFCGMAFDIEAACFKFFEEQKAMITKFVNHTAEFKRFGSFYISMDKRNRGELSQERADSICTSLVETFMNVEYTKTVVLIEMLHLGMDALVKGATRNTQLVSVSDDASATLVYVRNGMFVLGDDIFGLLNSILRAERPWYYEPILQIKERRYLEDDLRDEYPFQEEAIFAEIGRWILEAFSIVHILVKKIYPDYQLHLSLKKQKELLRELDAEQEKQSKKQQKTIKGKNKKKKSKDKSMNSKPEANKEQDSPDAKVGEDIPEKSINIKSGNSDPLSGVTTDFHQNKNDKIPDEPSTSGAKYNLESHMHDLSIEQSDTPWTRKERKRTKAARTSMKPPRESYQIRGSSSKEHKEYPSNREHSGNPSDCTGNFNKSQTTNEHSGEKMERIKGTIIHSVSSQPLKVVDLSEKSWGDFLMKSTFGSSAVSNITSSDPPEDYPYMNMIKYIIDGEF